VNATEPTGLDTAIVVIMSSIELLVTSVSLSKNVTLLVPRFSASESELAPFADNQCLRIYPPFTLPISGVSAVNESISILSLTT